MLDDVGTSLHKLAALMGLADRLMAAQETTLESVWRAAAGESITDGLLEWPPDVFALTEIVLEQSEAYRFVVSPPAGEHWPPTHISDWADAVVGRGRGMDGSDR